MAKKDKKPQVKAPVVDTSEEENKTPQTTIADFKKTTGLTQGEKVAYLTAVQNRKRELKSEDNPPAGLINGLSFIEDSAIIDIAVGEIACGTSAIGFILTGNEENYNALRIAAAHMHVTLPEFKTLPAPSKEQLAQVGIVSVSGAKLLTVSKKDVDASAVEKKKKEVKANAEALNGKKEYLTDHTKIKTEEELKEALGFQLVNAEVANPIERLVTAAQFYRAYLEASAEKSDDPKAELDKIHGYTLSDLLQDISTMVPPTFALEGWGKFIYGSAANAKSVIPAFNLFKRACTNRKTGVCRFQDEEIAAMVRVLIAWNSSAGIAEASKSIKNLNNIIKTLNKDPKANAKGIKSAQAEIEKENNKIKYYQHMIDLVTDPDFDIADNFIAAYNQEDNPNNKQAKILFKSIYDTYYAGVEIPELEMDTALLNIQQRIGIIINLFNSPLGKRDDYSEENIIALSSETEEKPAESEEPKDEPKNA